MARFRSLRLVLAALCVLAAVPALAAPPRFPDIMPASHLKPGMTGYGLTVFHGTRIERFSVRIVGIVKNGSLIVPGHDMILVHMSGGPMTTRQANLIRGMSGSPVYVNGKIIGAFSQGEPTTKEPLGGVTPIEDMLEAWDPKLPETPVASLPPSPMREVALKAPIVAGDRRIDRVIYNVPPGSKLRSHGSTLVMRACTTLMSVSGIGRAAREKLAALLEPYNVEVVQGAATGGKKTDFGGTPLVPGSAFSMMLLTGDQSIGATGTVSYRRGNRILGFGHPFLGIGPIDAPLCSAYVYDVYPLQSGSYKISSPGPVVGSSTQDRNFSISGVIGRQPLTVPITVDVRDATTGRSRVFHSRAVAHPNLYAALVSTSVASAVAEIRSIPGAAMAQIDTTVVADELGKIERTNTVFDMSGIDGAATADLDDVLGILTSNPFYPLGIKGATVTVRIESGRKTARIERIFVKSGRFEPGEEVEVGVVLKPYRQPSVTRLMKVRIPANAATGRLVLQVRGGAVSGAINLGGIVIRPSSGQGQEQAPPTNVRQMVDRYLERERNTDMVARLVMPTTAVNVEGERLSNLPPSLDAIMRSARSSGVRMERDEVRVVEPTDWVVSGQQVLVVNVKRRESLEGSTGAPRIAPPTTQPETPPAAASVSDGDEEAGDAGAEDLYAAHIGVAPRQTPKRSQPEESTPKGGDTARPQKPASADGAQPAQPAQPTPVPPTQSETPVSRAARVWRQATTVDFAKGDSHGVSVTSAGDLTLTRTLRRLYTSDEGFVWSVTSDGAGGMFAGTGSRGRILHIDATGRSESVADLPDLSIHALLRAADGTLYAATGPKGRTYRIRPGQKPEVLHEAPEKYALALARDPAGNLFIGTAGGHGTVYRVAPDGKATTFFRSPEEHVLALAVDGAGAVYVATSESGLVYRVSPDGTPKVLYDASQQSVTAVVVGRDGNVYIATAPKGAVYRIAPDGTSSLVVEKAPAALTCMASAPDGTLYAAGGDSVYAIAPDGRWQSLDTPDNVDVLSMAVGPDNSLLLGTDNVAEIYVAPPVAAGASGTYESVVHDAGIAARWGSLRSAAAAPPGTSVEVQTRSGNVSDPDSTWSGWATPEPQAGGARIASPPARYVQYRVALKADGSAAAPMLREVAISYLPRNQAPLVSVKSPAGGESWARQQTVRWQATDPDKDRLSYEVYVSADNGATWTPLPEGVAATKPTAPAPAPTAPAPAAPARPRPPSVEQVTAELDKHPNLPPALREAILTRARQANAQYDAADQQRPSVPEVRATGAPTQETSRMVDTRQLADGSYRIKVVASDRVSNPTDPRGAEAVSEPVTICNSPPVVLVYSDGTRANADRTVTLSGVALQAVIPLSAAQYRVDGGEWQAVGAADGLFDGEMETFSLTTAPLAAGRHTIEVKAFNAAGSTSSDTAVVEVK